MPQLITSDAELHRLVSRLNTADIIAIDIESNGLHVYAPRLCVLQIAWPEDDQMKVAIIDPFEVDIVLLRHVLGATGPIKLLHDLTFDARILADASIALENVRDTSVTARFLGEPATGLGTLVLKHLGTELKKALQHHNWAVRPFTATQKAYLAADVAHLHALDAILRNKAEQQGITEDVALECDYKLRSALGPPRDQRPPHLRLKGYQKLKPVTQAVLRRLVMAREEIAKKRDVPPFRIVENRVLFDLANAQSQKESGAEPARSTERALQRHWPAWRDAVCAGLADRQPPADEQPVDSAPKWSPTQQRLQQRLHKKLERSVLAWRRQEAAARHVDQQVILPGHCVKHVIEELMAAGPESSSLHTQLRAIDGLGDRRVERYADTWIKLI